MKLKSKPYLGGLDLVNTSRMGRKAFVDAAIPLLLGLAGFYLVVGPRVLNPMNISWLADGDPATHYLGWQFFRASDWSFPIGRNPSYGLELSNAIMYSDSNPLLAIPFKLFSSLLPEPFQYFGLWIFICFILQAWFGWKIVGLISDSTAIRALGTGLFVFAPPMIFRLTFHTSLAAHFLVIAALYLALRPMRARHALAWGLLLVVAALVHPYLLAMVAAIWLADLAGRTAHGQLPIRYALGELISLIPAVGFVCWQAGYFSVVSGLNSYRAYGLYRMNVLSILDSSGWSFTINDISEASGDYEGFNFLGLGVILLTLFAIPIAIDGRVGLRSMIVKNTALLCMIIGLILFSVSNKIGIGPHSLAFPIPDALLGPANIFRVSGRMFWPAFYALLTTVVFLVARGYDKRVAIFLLALALLVQIVDTQAKWGQIRQQMMEQPSSQWPTPLQDPFWVDAASRYRKVRWVLPRIRPPHWQTLAAYAGGHGLATDAVYLARVEQAAAVAARSKAATALATGQYEPDSLYLLDADVLGSAILGLDADIDLLARIDRFVVLAPGWKRCASCRAVAGELRVADVFPPLELGARVEFSPSAGNARFLVAGWSEPDAAGGTWSDGPVAEIVLPLSTDGPHQIVIEAGALVTPSHPRQDVEIRVNGTLAATVRLTSRNGNRMEVPVSEAARKVLAESGFLRLELSFPDAVRPTDLGINEDTRSLALHLKAVTVD